MNQKYQFVYALVITISMAIPAFAGSGLAVNTSGAVTNPLVDLSNNGATERVTSSDLVIHLRASCFATNLRSVGNPVSPKATLRMEGQYAINGGKMQPFTVSFPSNVVLGAGLTGSASYTVTTASSTGLTGGSQIGVSGNMLVVKLASADTAKLDPVTATITQTSSVFNTDGNSLQFYQIIPDFPIQVPSSDDCNGFESWYPNADAPGGPINSFGYAAYSTYRSAGGKACGAGYSNFLTYFFGKYGPTQAQYNDYVNYANARGNHLYSYTDYATQVLEKTFLGKTGYLSTGRINMKKSSDGKMIDIDAAFPGEDMYCGGYYSPLMAFFDDERPSFNNIADFNMHTGLKTYWPEKGHVGYFIALPHKGKVGSVSQLFGQNDKYKNGFDNLAFYDKNHDGVIDEKDPIFKKLVLWKDNSGNGVYNPKDAIPLYKKIKSIRLKYTPMMALVGVGAELREKGSFEFYANNGKTKKGTMIDVWFKPALGPDSASEQQRKLSSK